MLNDIPAFIASDPQLLHTFKHRFLAKLKIIPETGCWEFQGTRTRLGYGRFTFKYGNYSAHRISHIIHTGVIPDGLIILHACDNPPCCNPAHLRAGTHKENSQDMVVRGRYQPPAKYVNGERVDPWAHIQPYTLTQDDIEEVKLRLLAKHAIASSLHPVLSRRALD